MTKTFDNFEELAKMDLADFAIALGNMSYTYLNDHCGEILSAIDKVYDDIYKDEEEFGSDVYIECDDEDDDFVDNITVTGEDDYDPCEDPDLFRESLLNQW